MSQGESDTASETDAPSDGDSGEVEQQQNSEDERDESEAGSATAEDRSDDAPADETEPDQSGSQAESELPNNEDSDNDDENDDEDDDNDDEVDELPTERINDESLLNEEDEQNEPEDEVAADENADSEDGAGIEEDPLGQPQIASDEDMKDKDEDKEEEESSDVRMKDASVRKKRVLSSMEETDTVMVNSPNIDTIVSSNPPRLVINRIVLENFKSYAGKRVIGPFHRRFSAIVGPNGSGKSNVIDALLFVFGWRASKIRLKKLKELVHKSDRFPDCRQARVTIHFEEIIDLPRLSEDESSGVRIQDDPSKDRFEVVKGSQFTVSRVTTIESKSTYQLNDVVVPKQRIIDKLLDKGVDLTHNRFLILQGEVEAISLMKPKGVTTINEDGSLNVNEEGMLEYLEDIIGSNEYCAKIFRKSGELTTLNEEYNSKLNRVKAIEKDRDALDESKEEAMQLVKSEMKVFKCESVIRQIHKHHSLTESKKIDRKLHETRSIIDQSKIKQEETRKQLKDIDDEFQKLKKERSKVIKELKKAEKKWEKLEQKDASLSAEYKHTKTELKKSNQQLNKTEKQMKKDEELIQESETKIIPECNERIEQLCDEIANAFKKHQESLESVAAQIGPLRDQMESKQAELSPFMDRLNEYNNERETAMSNLEMIENKYNEKRNHLNKSMNKINELNQEYQSFMKELQKYNETLQQYTHELSDSMRKRDLFAKQRHELNEKLDHLRKEYENKKQSFDNFQKRTGVCKVLMEAQNRGQLSGICGRLGDLGSIDSKYDIAASTAGGALNDIVVRSTAEAQRAINFLKANQLGRVTFLCLDQQQSKFGSRVVSLDRHPDADRLLINLVRTNDKYRVAFYYCFFETIVAQDLSEANRIAYGNSSRESGGRKRVVTLDGNIIEPSGVMSGGGRNQRRGAINLTHGEGSSSSRRSARSAPGGDDESQIPTAEELRDLQQKLNEYQKQMSDIGIDRSNLENRLKHLNNAIDRDTRSKRKIEMNLEHISKRLEQAMNKIPELRERMGDSSSEDGDSSMMNSLMRDQNMMDELMKNVTEMSEEDKNECKKLKRQITTLELKVNEINEETSGIRDEIKQLAEQIRDNGGSKTQKLKAALEDLKKEDKDVKKRLSKAKVDIKRCKEKMGKNEEKCQQIKSEIDSLKKRKAEINEEQSKIETEASSCLDEKTALKQSLESTENRNNELMGMVDTKQSELEDLTQRIIEAEDSIADEEKRQEKLIRYMDKLDEEFARFKSKYLKHKTEFLDGFDLFHQAKEGSNDDSDDQKGAQNDDEDSKQQNSDDEEDVNMMMQDDRHDGDGMVNAEDKDHVSLINDHGILAYINDISIPVRELLAELPSSEDDLGSDNENNNHNNRMNDERSMDIANNELISNIDQDSLEEYIKSEKRKINELSKEVNIGSIESWKMKDKEYVRRADDLKKLLSERNEMRAELEKLKKLRHDIFMQGFDEITQKLKEKYRMLTLGGDAELELVDSIDPFSEGVTLSVRPPKKSWKQISNLSGGEKTLSSMALVFALHHFRPTPLYFMDEIDAALDFKNVSIVGNYIQQRTMGNAQFIIISLRNDMFERAHRLIGIYKRSDCSKSVTIDPNRFRIAKQPSSAAKSAVASRQHPSSSALSSAVVSSS